MEKDCRTELLIGENGLNKLANANILLVGVGGVGGYVAEMLIRAGIKSLTIVDYDCVDITNINRQIIALNSTVGKQKVSVLKDRLLDIDCNANILAINEKLEENNVDLILKNDYDFVIDAIDDVKNKLLLIQKCKESNIEIISALGSGNRIEIPHFEVTDISKTENDGLAKKIRLGLREIGINHHKVVYSKQNRVHTNNATIGSISYFPAMCGIVLASYVINKILEEK